MVGVDVGLSLGVLGVWGVGEGGVGKFWICSNNSVVLGVLGLAGGGESLLMLMTLSTSIV